MRRHAFPILLALASVIPAALDLRPASPFGPSTVHAQAIPASSALETLRAGILGDTQLPGVRRGTWAIAVQSLDRQERLVSINDRALMVPASVTKLVSTAAAVEAVGWDYRFETLIRTNGTLDADGTLRGDLFIVGSGDPSLGGRAGDDMSSWVAAMQALGIRRIEGRVIGDDDAIEEPRPQLSWAWDDLGYTYGAIYGALNFEENRMSVTVSPAATAGGVTRMASDPLAGARPLINRSVTGPAGSPPFIWPEQRPGETTLTIAGSVPAGGTAVRTTVSVGNPTHWVASSFRARLQSAGIAVTHDAFDIDDIQPAPLPATTVLHVHRSRALAEIAKPMMKDSINLYAEALLRLVAEPGVLPTNDAALAGLKKRLSAWGVPEDAYGIVDGSGLSRRDTISPELLLVVLGRLYDATNTSPWMQTLPVGGVDGSLSNRMKGTAAENNVRAKTGSMSSIRSLAGYVTTADGEHLAFVVMTNNFEGTGAMANQAIDSIAVRLATFRR